MYVWTLMLRQMLILEIILYGASIFHIKVGFLSQTKSMPIWLVLLASLLQECPVSIQYLYEFLEIGALVLTLV